MSVAHIDFVVGSRYASVSTATSGNSACRDLAIWLTARSSGPIGLVARWTHSQREREGGREREREREEVPAFLLDDLLFRRVSAVASVVVLRDRDDLRAGLGGEKRAGLHCDVIDQTLARPAELSGDTAVVVWPEPLHAEGVRESG